MDVELTFVPDDRELNGVGPDTDEGHLSETSVVGWFRFRVGDHEILPAPRHEALRRAADPGWRRCLLVLAIAIVVGRRAAWLR